VVRRAQLAEAVGHGLAQFDPAAAVVQHFEAYLDTRKRAAGEVSRAQQQRQLGAAVRGE
jgi:hypothetical protein